MSATTPMTDVDLMVADLIEEFRRRYTTETRRPTDVLDLGEANWLHRNIGDLVRRAIDGALPEAETQWGVRWAPSDPHVSRSIGWYGREPTEQDIRNLTPPAKGYRRTRYAAVEHVTEWEPVDE